MQACCQIETYSIAVGAGILSAVQEAVNAIPPMRLTKSVYPCNILAAAFELTAIWR